MCNVTGIVFAVKNLSREEVESRTVIEVGSSDVNGSLRPIIESWKPLEYVGVDIQEGPGVDQVCDVGDLVETFGKNRFDIVVATELLEHVRDWRRAITNLKNVCRPGGIAVITTRSPNFPYHGYPHDFWRFELEDLTQIFADCDILALEKDDAAPGVFAKVRKPADFVERSLVAYELHSVVVGGRVREIADSDLGSIRFRRLMLRRRLRSICLRGVDLMLSRV